MNLDGIIDFRSFTLDGTVEFVDDPSPARYGVVDDELVLFEPGDPQWRAAPYELRHVKSSTNPNVPAPCVVLFSRVEKESSSAREALAAIAKLDEGYRFLAAGERIAPEDEIFGDAISGYFVEADPSCRRAWIPASEFGLWAYPGNLVPQDCSKAIRRSLAVEAAWPKRPCDTCRFFFEHSKLSCSGDCRRHAPASGDTPMGGGYPSNLFPIVFRQFWCGDWERIEMTDGKVSAALKDDDITGLRLAMEFARAEGNISLYNTYKARYEAALGRAT